MIFSTYFFSKEKITGIKDQISGIKDLIKFSWSMQIMA